MESVVNLPLCGELHVVGYWADDFCDFKGAKALGLEFCGEVCCFQVCSFDPYLLSFLIGVECCLLIPECLCLGHGLMHIFSCLLHLSFSPFHCWYISFSHRLVGTW
jgi:hypothetical protein